MTAVELIANKFQNLLGGQYKIIPMAQLETDYTTAEEVVEGDNHGFITRYTSKFTQLRAKKIIGILNLQNPVRANADFYYITTNYTIEFSVPTNVVKTKEYKDGNDVKVRKETKFDFFNDIENAINEIVNKKIMFGTKYGKMTISEPIYKGKETDGENECTIYIVSGVIVISDKAVFGGEYEIKFLIGDEYVKIDDVNTYNENNDNSNNAIMKQGKTKVEQNLSQLGWVATFSIDDKISNNLARKLIYDIIHENREIINKYADTEAKEHKIMVKIISPHGNVHLFYAILSIGFGTNQNGVGVYTISLTDDNKELKEFTLSFDSDGGSEVEDKEIKEFDELGELPLLTKAGFELDTWKIDNLPVNENSVYKYNTNKTAVAHWIGKEINITLDNQDATTSGTESVKARYTEAMPPITIPTRQDLDIETIPVERVFLGYFTEREGAGIKYYNADGTSAKNLDLTEDTTLYAYWQPILVYTGLDAYGEITENEEDIVSYMVGDDSATYGNALIDNSLTNIVIPETFASKPIIKIGQYAFAQTNITSVTLGENITTLSKEAFRECLLLETINYNCINATMNVSNAQMWRDAGKNSGGITVNIGDNVTSIPDTLFLVGDEMYKANITSIVFGENSSCVSIGSLAFGQLNLTTLTLPNSVTSIGKNAFVMSGITSLTLGNQISYFENVSTFHNMEDLITLTVNAIEPPTFKYKNPLPFKDSSNLANIYVPSQSVDAYKNTRVWNYYANLIVAKE